MNKNVILFPFFFFACACGYLDVGDSLSECVPHPGHQIFCLRIGQTLWCCTTQSHHQWLGLILWVFRELDFHLFVQMLNSQLSLFAKQGKESRTSIQEIQKSLFSWHVSDDDRKLWLYWLMFCLTWFAVLKFLLFVMIYNNVGLGRDELLPVELSEVKQRELIKLLKAEQDLPEETERQKQPHLFLLFCCNHIFSINPCA